MGAGRSRNGRRVRASLLGVALAATGFGVLRAADHDDSPSIGTDQAADIADVYAFRSPQNPGNVSELNPGRE